MLNAKQKVQSGFTIIELLIVIAIIGILATLVLTNFQGAQAKGRDTVRKNDINSLYQKLEEYYNENGGYPNTGLTDTVLAGADEGAFEDADGAAIVSSFSTGTTAPTFTLTNTNEYAYGGYECGSATAAALPNVCGKYVLATFLERESQYEKTSLN